MPACLAACIMAAASISTKIARGSDQATKILLRKSAHADPDGRTDDGYATRTSCLPACLSIGPTIASCMVGKISNAFLSYSAARSAESARSPLPERESLRTLVNSLREFQVVACNFSDPYLSI